MGEAARKLSQDLKDQHPEIEWRQLIGMRNNLVHGYFQIAIDIVWSVVEDDLADLKVKIEAILQSLGGNP